MESRGIVESVLDSVELWNLRWILHFLCEILRNCRIAGGFESLKRERTLLLAKAKSSKRFYALCAKFWKFVESRADSVI